MDADMGDGDRAPEGVFVIDTGEQAEVNDPGF